MKYTLEQLLQRFKEDSERFGKEEADFGTEGHFNLPDAFVTILTEIKNLKEELKEASK